MRTKRESTVPRHRAAVAEAVRLLNEHQHLRGYLAALHHPLAWRREMGETQLEWCEFQFAHGSVSGQATAVRVVRRAATVLGVIE